MIVTKNPLQSLHMFIVVCMYASYYMTQRLGISSLALPFIASM